MSDQYVTISVAGSSIYAVQKADGTRYASAYSFTEAVNKAHISIADFLGGNSPEALPYKGSVWQKMKNPRGNKPMNGLPLEVGVAYWHYQARKGNKEAQAKVRALTQEALDVRIDGALGIHTTMAQVETRTTQNALAILEKLYTDWDTMPRSEWTSSWRNSELIQDIKSQYMALTDEEQKEFLRQHSGLEFHIMHYKDGSTEVMVRDLTGQ